MHVINHGCKDQQRKIGPILADYPEIDEEKCTECGICIKECPHGAVYKE
jgi:ferredoxin